jgi:hypothetical protein
VVRVPRVFIPVAIHCRSGFAFALAFGRARFFLHIRESVGVAKFLGAQQRVFANAVQQVGLPGLQRDQPPEDVEKIEQVAGVFR